MKFQSRTFDGETVTVDGNEYIDCAFNKCVLEYCGGKPPSIVDCKFDSPSISFTHQAADTLNFLTALYHGGFKEIIEQTFENIRSNSQPSSIRTFH